MLSFLRLPTPPALIPKEAVSLPRALTVSLLYLWENLAEIWAWGHDRQITPFLRFTMNTRARFVLINVYTSLINQINTYLSQTTTWIRPVCYTCVYNRLGYFTRVLSVNQKQQTPYQLYFDLSNACHFAQQVHLMGYNSRYTFV